MMIKYVSLFSGIEAAKVAFDRARIEAKPLAFFEIDKFCSKLLADKFPDVVNYGDVRNFDFSVFKGKIDFLCGGSPCQSFSLMNSVSKNHSGTDLMEEFVRAVREAQPDYFFYENVPQANIDFQRYLSPGIFAKDKYALIEDYDVFRGDINSADFGFMQSRNRFYCVGKRNNIGGKSPYIRVKNLCKEDLAFGVIPATKSDIKQYREHPELVEDNIKYHYSLQNWTKRRPKNKVPCVLSTKPLIMFSKHFICRLSADAHEELQVFPRFYTDGFSYCQRIKMIGNSWHVGIVAEIFKQIFSEKVGKNGDNN